MADNSGDHQQHDLNEGGVNYGADDAGLNQDQYDFDQHIDPQPGDETVTNQDSPHGLLLNRGFRPINPVLPPSTAPIPLIRVSPANLDATTMEQDENTEMTDAGAVQPQQDEAQHSQDAAVQPQSTDNNPVDPDDVFGEQRGENEDDDTESLVSSVHTEDIERPKGMDDSGDEWEEYVAKKKVEEYPYKVEAYTVYLEEHRKAMDAGRKPPSLQTVTKRLRMARRKKEQAELEAAQPGPAEGQHEQQDQAAPQTPVTTLRRAQSIHASPNKDKEHIPTR
ncbi:hypothetical protein CSUB01_12673, partial [Colletotrichum sublineola]